MLSRIELPTTPMGHVALPRLDLDADLDLEADADAGLATAEAEQVLSAWNQECRKSTEYELLLGRTRRLLRRLLVAGETSPENRRRIRSVLEAVAAVTEDLQDERG